MTTENLTYSKPVTALTIKDWPYGRMRTTAVFSIETSKHGQRAVRTTTNPKSGRENKPKKTRYSKQVRIVEGSDGRVYIASMSQYSDSGIEITKSDLHFQADIIYPDHARHPMALALFD